MLHALHLVVEQLLRVLQYGLGVVLPEIALRSCRLIVLATGDHDELVELRVVVNHVPLPCEIGRLVLTGSFPLSQI